MGRKPMSDGKAMGCLFGSAIGTIVLLFASLRLKKPIAITLICLILFSVVTALRYGWSIGWYILLFTFPMYPLASDFLKKRTQQSLLIAIFGSIAWVIFIIVAIIKGNS